VILLLSNASTLLMRGKSAPLSIREATCKINRMPAISKDDKLQLLRIILESRHADLREQNLIRQGKGHFHVSGMGHEALAAVSIQIGAR